MGALAAPRSHRRRRGGTTTSAGHHQKLQQAGGALARLLVVYLLPGRAEMAPFVEMGCPRQELDCWFPICEMRGCRAVCCTGALFVISAHWEEPVPTVMMAAAPALFDYYGFPPASCLFTWSAAGDPLLAARRWSFARRRGSRWKTDEKRGFDHGTFVPPADVIPTRDVKVVQLSRRLGSIRPLHLAMGSALAPLRDEGIFIIGSGMSLTTRGVWSATRA